MMMLAKITLLLAVGSAAAFEETSLRGSGSGNKAGQFACSIAGAPGQDACDAAKDTDGTSCVWCSMSSIGFCVSETQAEAIEDKFPTVTCDSDSKSDDDAAPATDDAAPATDDDAATADDDNTPDPSPDDYWKCLKSSKDEKTCSGAGCTWCMTSVGYGICLSKDAADQADKSDWFTCSAALGSGEVAGPFDTSCLMATLTGEESCEEAADQDGGDCEWCTIAGHSFCLSSDQAEFAGQAGAQCGSSSSVDTVAGPFDTSCLLATLSGDADECQATTDEDGEACEWCAVAGQNFCLTSDQAAIAGQMGGQCGEAATSQVSASDPYDPTCLLATLSGDEDECESTSDKDGEPCEWCKLGVRDICLTSEQAEIAGQVGAQCSSSSSSDELFSDDMDVFDPYDTSCLIASLSGDSDACASTSDQDGQKCEWCTIGGFGVCLTVDQAGMAGQAGAECDANISVEEEDADIDAVASSPYDTSCLVASLSNDESACESTEDQDGEACQWCVLSSVGLCLTSEQADLASEIGADCNTASIAME